MHPGRRRTVAHGLLAGGCIAFSMPPWGWWPLTPIGLALFAGLIHDVPVAARFLRGWLVGAAWLVPSTCWMLDFSPPGYVVAGLVLSAYLGAGAALVPRRGTARLLALPAVVAGAEFLRTLVPFGGIPLSTVAMSQSTAPLLPIARVGGTVALTLATGTVAVAVVASHQRAWRAAAAAALALAALGGLAAVAPRGNATGPLDVALVQGGGPQRTRAVNTDSGLVLERHLRASQQVRSPVGLVLWPENVVSVDGPLAGSAEERRLVDLARRLGAPLIAGIVESFPDRFTNASVVITPDGRTVSRYDKIRRVPFGEYIPLRGAVDALSGGMASRYVPNDAVAGTGPAILETPTGTVGVVISWEVFFERRARDAIGHGGEVLLNPTNGSSYWLTIVQTQQVASSRLRAVETGRWVLQAAPTGFSAVVTPAGDVLERTGISEAAVLHTTIQRRQGLTWSVRFGPWPSLATAGVALAAAWAFGLRDERRRRAAALTGRPDGGAPQPTATDRDDSALV